MPQEQLPLHWPDAFFKTPARTNFAWLIRASPFSSVKEGIAAQLVKRPSFDLSIWGEDPLRVQVARKLCKLIKETYDWPCDRFLPDDPLDIVCLTPWDDLELAELAVRIEELGVHIETDEIYRLNAEHLNDLVTFVLSKMK